MASAYHRVTQVQPVIPLGLIINESRMHRVADFLVQQQSCGVNGLQPLQVLESMAMGMAARNLNVIVKSLVD